MSTPAPNAITKDTVRGGTVHVQAMADPMSSAPPAIAPHAKACSHSGT